MKYPSTRKTCWLGVAMVVAMAIGCDRSDSTEASAESPSSGSQGSVQKAETEGMKKGTKGTEEGDENKDQKEQTAGKAENAASKLPKVEAMTLDDGKTTLAPEASATLVNLWATWCAPCLAEMPEISDVHREWESDGLRTVALSIESKKAEEKVADYVDENEPAFEVMFAPKPGPLESFGAGSVPATFLYDAEGQLVWSRDGKLTDRDFESLRSELESRLGG